MKRKVICETKELRRTEGRAPTPELSTVVSNADGTVTIAAPEAPLIVINQYYMVFYDSQENASYHRNAYSMVLTADEADKFEVGKVYSISIN